MASISTVLSWGILLLLVPTTLALKFTPGSPCAAVCLDDPSADGFDPSASVIVPSDIVCTDGEYTKPGTAGPRFLQCVDCLRKSDKVNGTETDLAWMLYNLRFAASTCLFDWVDTDPAAAARLLNSTTPAELHPASQPGSPCQISSACGPIGAALLSDKLDPHNPSEFGYCTASRAVFATWYVRACESCLQSSTDQTYIANFFIALQAACALVPGPGDILQINGNLFSSSPVAFITPSASQSAAAAATANNNATLSTLTAGTLAGIGVGVGLLVIGVAAFLMLRCRQRTASRRAAAAVVHGSPTSPETSSITAIYGAKSSSWIDGRTPSLAASMELQTTTRPVAPGRSPARALLPRPVSRSFSSAQPAVSTRPLPPSFLSTEIAPAPAPAAAPCLPDGSPMPPPPPPPPVRKAPALKLQSPSIRRLRTPRTYEPKSIVPDASLPG